MTTRPAEAMPAQPAMVPTATMSVADGPEPTPATREDRGSPVMGAQARGRPGTPDPTTTEAWARGIERAATEAAQRPPDDGTMSVWRWAYPEWETWRMCLTCHWERGSERCPH